MHIYGANVKIRFFFYFLDPSFEKTLLFSDWRELCQTEQWPDQPCILVPLILHIEFTRVLALCLLHFVMICKPSPFGGSPAAVGGISYSGEKELPPNHLQFAQHSQQLFGEKPWQRKRKKKKRISKEVLRTFTVLSRRTDRTNNSKKSATDLQTRT